MSRYLSREVVLAAYSRLRRMSENPSDQGQTQKTSILRYAVALDAFGQIKRRDCVTTDSDDKKTFIDLVGKAVAIAGDLYTANFYNELKISPDYCVNSNFFSANVVPLSRRDPETVYSFPRRYYAVLNVKNGTLLSDEIHYDNLSCYLTNSTLRCAFAVWLMRNERFSDSACNDTFNIELERAFVRSNYSDALKNALWEESFFEIGHLAPNSLEAFSSLPLHLTENDVRSTWSPQGTMPDIAYNEGIEPATMMGDQAIEMHCIDGNPLGIKVCRLNLSQMITLVIPRALLSRTKELKDLPSRGVYYLFNQTKTGIRKAYAGQTCEGIKRLDGHDKAKDWWNVAVIHLAPESSLNLDVVQHLEASAIDQLINSSIPQDNLKRNKIRVDSYTATTSMQIFNEIQFRMQALGFLID